MQENASSDFLTTIDNVECTEARELDVIVDSVWFPYGIFDVEEIQDL